MEEHVLQTTNNYLEACRYVLELLRGNVPGSYFDIRGKPVPKSQADSARTWAWDKMRSTRIFSFHPEDYLALHHAADVFVDEAATGVPWTPVTGRNDGKGDTYVAEVPKLVADMPFPGPTPFSNCWFGYGGGVTFQPHNAYYEGLPTEISTILPGGRMEEDVSVRRWVLLGHLMVWSKDLEDGRIMAFFAADLRLPDSVKDGMTARITATTIWSSKGAAENHGLPSQWVSQLSLAPWILQMFVDLINDHNTMIVDGSKLSPQYKSRFKKAKRNWVEGFSPPLPRPYHVSRIKRQTITLDKMRRKYANGPSWTLNHRVPVRSHDRLYCKRWFAGASDAPDAKEMAKLVARGYDVYPPGIRLPGQYALALSKRGKRARSFDEFMAVKVVRIDEHERGPHNAPLIPSVRTVQDSPGGKRGKKRRRRG